MNLVMLCSNKPEVLERAKKENWIKEVKLNGGRYLMFAKDASIYDGELVVFNDEGVSRLELYQNREKYLDRLTFVMFDVIRKNGTPTINLPLKERRELLDKNAEPLLFLSREGVVCKYNPQIKLITEIPVWDYETSKKKGVEGFVWKNPESKYVFSRSDDWVKEKFSQIITCEIKRWEITENNGFVIYITYEGVENRIVVNNIKEQEKIRNGSKSAKIKFLDVSEKGKLICPSFIKTL